MVLPSYLDCNSEEITHCDFFMLEDCPETCGFALDIKGLEKLACPYKSNCSIKPKACKIKLNDCPLYVLYKRAVRKVLMQ